MEIAAIGFVLFVIVVAAITFFVLKKAIRMAIRTLIVFLILLIGIVGAASLWYFGANYGDSKTPVTNKKSR